MPKHGPGPEGFRVNSALKAALSRLVVRTKLSRRHEWIEDAIKRGRFGHTDWRTIFFTREETKDLAGSHSYRLFSNEFCRRIKVIVILVPGVARNTELYAASLTMRFNPNAKVYVDRLREVLETFLWEFTDWFFWAWCPENDCFTLRLVHRVLNSNKDDTARERAYRVAAALVRIIDERMEYFGPNPPRSKRRRKRKESNHGQASPVPRDPGGDSEAHDHCGPPRGNGSPDE